MRLTSAVSLVFALGLLWMPSAQASIPLNGTWMGSAERDRLQLSIRGTEEHGQIGLSLQRSELKGLNTHDGPETSFRLEHEAGVLHFQGRFAGGKGAGHYRFEPNAAYVKELAALGYTGITPEEQLQLALFDVGPTRLRGLAELGYTKLSREELFQVGIFNVTPEHIRAMKSAGFDKLSMEQLVATRVHDVTPEHVQALKSAGYTQLSFEDVLATSLHDVTPQHIQAMKSAGFDKLSL
ncbi:MAG TPA: 4-hydroxy-3-methylbut-2-enyl diphosphate reductase, partial [Myxococcaceae bacterium]|nr:4-hydroxy-3-methylbut-2-enyl diphosphate reductase [Myxococcaceae bacterium]